MRCACMFASRSMRVWLRYSGAIRDKGAKGDCTGEVNLAIIYLLFLTVVLG